MRMFHLHPCELSRDKAPFKQQGFALSEWPSHPGLPLHSGPPSPSSWNRLFSLPPPSTPADTPLIHCLFFLFCFVWTLKHCSMSESAGLFVPSLTCKALPEHPETLSYPSQLLMMAHFIRHNQEICCARRDRPMLPRQTFKIGWWDAAPAVLCVGWGPTCGDGLLPPNKCSPVWSTFIIHQFYSLCLINGPYRGKTHTHIHFCTGLRLAHNRANIW